MIVQTVKRMVWIFVLHLMAAGIHAQKVSRISITDFGAVPDSRLDAVPAIRKALAACKGKSNTILVFPKGRYDLYPDSAARKEYYLSNTSSEQECPSKWKTIGMLIEDMKDLVIDGQGSLLIYHGKMITFALDHSRNIRIRDLDIDFERPSMSEFIITGRTPTDITVRVHPDSWYRLEGGHLVWYGEGWTAQHAHCIRIDTGAHTMYYANEAYGALMKAEVSEMAPMHLQFHGRFDTSRWHVGNVFTVRDPIRDEVGALLLQSKDIGLEQVGMHYMHGLGILSQYSENISMKEVMVEPRKETGRWIASFADGMHFSGCKGRVVIDGCRFTGLHDDPINVHGTHLKIQKKLSDRRLVVRFMHEQTYGFQAFFENDSIAYTRPATLETYAYGKVVSSKRIQPREIELVLDSPIPPSMKEGDVIENISWTPQISIRHCLITGSNTRGLLVTTRRKVVIEDNEFRNLGMQAILIADDALSWYESGPVKDVLIRNNRFMTNGHLINPSYTIVIAPEDHQLTGKPVHRNIRIENNQFWNYTDAVLSARSVEGLRFTGNKVRYQQAGEPAKKINLEDCKKVEIRDNEWSPVRKSTIK